MKVFEGTDLPDDFFNQVVTTRKADVQETANATWDAVVKLLGRPLNHRERLAVVEAVHAGRVDSTSLKSGPELPLVRPK